MNPADLCTTKATRYGRSILLLQANPGRELAVLSLCPWRPIMRYYKYGLPCRILKKAVIGPEE